MEVDDASAAAHISTTVNQVQPHNEHLAKTQSPQQQQQQRSAVVVKQQGQQQHHNRKSKSKTPQPQALDDSAEAKNWPRLLVSSDEENTTDLQLKNNNKQSDKAELQLQLPQAAEAEELALNSEEERTIAYCAKFKRYEVSRLGSSEILLGCDEATGELCLVSESEIAANNMAERENSKQEKATEAATAVKQELTDDDMPSAKRLKRSPAGKSTPPQEDVKKQQKVKIEQKPAESAKPAEPMHIVGDAEERVNNVPTIAPNAKLRSTSNGKATPVTPKQMSAQDDFYKKPFEYGWKRELVWRATPESGRERADVYFISPAGKKIRTRHDIPPLLQGELKMEHFCWLREPVGMGPEFETVRNAKPNPNRTSIYAAATLAASAPTPVTGKRMPKPKGPKGASPPPEGWTPTRALKVNNAALNSRSCGFGGSSHSTPTYTRSTSIATGTRNSSLKKKPPTTTTITAAATAQSVVSSQAMSGSGGVGKSVVSGGAIAKEATNDSVALVSTRIGCEPCTLMCSSAPGIVPQLKCVKCLCLYHHQCVGLSPYNSVYRRAGEPANGREYVCESCNPKSKSNDASPKKSSNSTSATPTTLANATATSAKLTNATTTTATSKLPLTNSRKIATTTTTIKPTTNARATSSNKRSSAIAAGNNKYPQTIAVVKGKKYVVVDKPRIKSKSKEYANDIDNDLKQINDSIRNSVTTQPTLAKIESAFPQQHSASATSLQTTQIQGKFFFANANYAYESLLTILKYLKIHERMRFASVCKLWYAAANSRSVWQTVRMKNSKVCNWSGCAAALQRNGTKHLDLRKMLFPGARSDEAWTDFSAHIGNACYLEIIDLCRCPARVVESLFNSNRNLRILNAITINDDSLNLENISNLSNLQELRLRTNEPAVLTAELKSLSQLSKLTHLSLTAIRSLSSKNLESLTELKALNNLELGECGGLDDTFAQNVLPQLTELQRLRLENGQDTGCCTLSILEAVGKLKHLMQLELVNFDVRPGFEERLQQCKALTKLLIIPTYLSQSATTNQTVLDAVQKMCNQLKVFTWGVTVELLRVTALYVDQCDETSKKEKHHFDECIPVLKPVPGAAVVDENDADLDNSGSNSVVSSADAANDVPQIEILPLDKVERILTATMPQTKFQIVKVPYHLTCKQQLVE